MTARRTIGRPRRRPPRKPRRPYRRPHRFRKFRMARPPPPVRKLPRKKTTVRRRIRARLPSFVPRSTPTAPGSTTRSTAPSGCRIAMPSVTTSRPTSAPATGRSPTTTTGSGRAITRSAASCSTTGVGFGCPVRAGPGWLAVAMPTLGSRGGCQRMTTVTSAGRPCLRPGAGMAAARSRSGGTRPPRTFSAPIAMRSRTAYTRTSCTIGT